MQLKLTSRRQFLLLAGQGSLAVGTTALLAACGAPSARRRPRPPRQRPRSRPPPNRPRPQPPAPPPRPTAPAAAPTAAPPPPTAAPAAAPTTAPAAVSAGDINLYVGGDVNIRDLWQKQLLPAYKKIKPNVTLTLIFDEHALSEQSVFDKLAAAKQAGAISGVDLWEASRIPQAGEAGLMQKLSSKEIPNLDKVDKGAFDRYGGFGAPYRASSVILAYNSATVKDPPTTLDALIAWVKNNDGQFTYNPPDKGGSGGNFTERVLSVGIPPDQLAFFQTQYDEAKESLWDQGWQTLKDLHPHIFNNGFYPQGNVPVLQTLGKGSISMAPVWSDQSLSYLAQKLLPPEVKLLQIDPPFAGSAAFLGIPSDSKNKDVLYEMLNWLLTPEPQQIVVEQINGYPAWTGSTWRLRSSRSTPTSPRPTARRSVQSSGTDRNKLWYEKVAGTPPPA